MSHNISLKVSQKEVLAELGNNSRQQLVRAAPIYIQMCHLSGHIAVAFSCQLVQNVRFPLICLSVFLFIYRQGCSSVIFSKILD